jgi:hypothetical protein
VDWFTGRGRTGAAPLSAAEQQQLTSFASGGGNLFVTGTNVASALAAGGTADGTFLNDVLHADLGTGTNAGSIEGAAGSIFDGLTGVALDDSTHGTYDVGEADPLAASGATPVARFAGSIAIAGLSWTTPGKGVFLSAPFEAVVSRDQRVEIMRRVLQFFAIPAEEFPDGGAPAPEGVDANPIIIDFPTEPGPRVGCHGEAGGAPIAGILSLVLLPLWRGRRRPSR